MCNTKVQHVCCALTLLCGSFSRKVLLTFFNLGYTRHFVNDFFLIRQPSQQTNQKIQNKVKQYILSVSENATCAKILHVLLRFYISSFFYIYKQKNQ